MARDITDAVRELCLGHPEAEEKASHGMRDFRVRGRTFATYAVNHHGDGRVALWLAATPGTQEHWTEHEPEHFFVPPYVGPRGWLGVHLNRDLDWARIAEHVLEAYAVVAPAALARGLAPVDIEPPTVGVDEALFDPFSAPKIRDRVAKLRAICLALPETAEGQQFGSPMWRAGKKTFCVAHFHDGRLHAQFWAGREMQAALADDPRFTVPAYVGHNGWLAVDLERRVNWSEVAGLVEGSYRHFALKRMLRALDG